jgi:hypothetical protein
VESTHQLVGDRDQNKRGLVSTQTDGAIDQVVAYNNKFGISFYPQSTSLSLVATVSNSLISKNSDTGVPILAVLPTVTKITIVNVTAASNGTAISSNGPASVLLNRSVVAGNGTIIKLIR